MGKRFNWADHECNRWCKVHYYWDFESDMHMPLPNTYHFKAENGWHHATVFVGPPAYYPKKPSDLQWVNIRMICPHNPPQLTCNTCRRHEFRAIPV